ncbi:MAG: ankyrin repeat domain-containing protein [Gammaproteobacteria bacterium]|nr:ankyrin repeat domain-containing protein [Gammaproteobacteria bacterium]
MFHRLVLSLLLVVFLTSCDSPQQKKKLPTLMDAAEQGDLEVMDGFLVGRQLVNMRNACLWTPLMLAALNGHYEAVEKLLDKGAEVDMVDKGGYSAMMLAASNNFPFIVELLIEKGADVNRVENTNGWTALIWSAKQGHEAVVQVLLNYQADKAVKDLTDTTAMQYAQLKKYESVIDLLKQD